MSTDRSGRHLPKRLDGFLPTPHDMGWTATPLGYVPSGPKTMLKPGPTVVRAAHESPLESQSIVLDLSDRRLRQTKSYTLPRKKHKTITGNIFRSYSVTTGFSVGKGTTTSNSPGYPSKRDRKLVCFLVGRYMRYKIRSARRCSRWRVLQARFWSPLPPRSHMVSSCVL